MKRKIVVIFLVLGLFLGVCGFMAACWDWIAFQPPDPVTNAINKIPLGTSRAQALHTLSDAQRHVECWYPDKDGIDDLFFYGSRNMDDAKVVIVRSDVISGQLQVSQVGTFENYALRTQYGDCVKDDDLSTQAP